MAPRKRSLDTDRVVSDIELKPAPKRRLKPTNPHQHSLSALPYHVLTDILSFLPATTPPAFLLSCATLCRALHDPAIATLYHTPHTSPPSRAHRLLATLRARPSLGVKVRALNIEAEPLLTTKLSGTLLDLPDLLRLTPRLRELRILHSADHTPRWRYPDALWAALEAAPQLHLHTWRWARALLPPSMDTTDLPRITSRCLTSLRHIELVGFDDDDDDDSEDAPNQIAAALALSHITTASFTACSAVGPTLLSRLADSAGIHLRELRLTNCPLVTSADLAAFLVAPACAALCVLEVIKCRGCSLAFTDCLPGRLENFVFEGHLQPCCEPPLPGGGPVWPETLQTLEATSLRGWSVGECERFLSSVVAAVPRMRALRRLRVWCMLADIGWRERSAFRERWKEEVAAVFAGAEVKFDNARPAEQLWGEEDFVAMGGEGGGGRGRARTRARGKGATAAAGRGGMRGGARGGARGGGRGGGRGRGRAGKNVVVVVKEVVSEGDEDYVDDE